MALAVAACNGHGVDGDSVVIYSVGGSISGLSSAGLVLQNNGGGDLTLAAHSRSFRFPVAAGSDYNIAVATQPAGLTCAVSHGAGTDVRASNFDVVVACSPITYTIAGTITGLIGNGLVLQSNGGDDLTVAANATTFEFAIPVTYGGSYAVTVLTHPVGQACSIANASGAPTADVSDVALTCAAVQFGRFDGHDMILSNERIARDSGTGDPFYFVFVDNTSSVSPDGGYQHSYPTLALAETNSAPHHIIYVFPGDGTTTGMDAGIALQADQKFWGAGRSHVIQSSEGSVTIPAGAASAPQITNTAGDGITLATDNDVSGFVLTNVVGSGIFGAGAKRVEISGNAFNNGTSISSVPLVITAGTGVFFAAIQGNTFSGNATGAMHVVLNDAESVLSITGNTIINNGSGALGPLGAAIFIDPNNTTAGNCQLTLSDNTISGNAASALYAFNGGYDNFQVTASDNTITGNGGGGFVFANAANTFTLIATGNTISGGGDHGIATGGGLAMTTATLTLTHNHITGNTNFGNGIVLSHEGTALNFVATGNVISDNDTSGILLFPSVAIANVVASIENNTISNNRNLGFNAAAGIDLEQFTNLSVELNGNTLSNSAASDVFVGSTEPAPAVCLGMSGNDSDMGYVLSGGTGVFDLAPLDVATVNTGVITTIGAITAIQACPP